jgi:hypothetical protein
MYTWALPDSLVWMCFQYNKRLAAAEHNSVVQGFTKYWHPGTLNRTSVHCSINYWWKAMLNCRYHWLICQWKEWLTKRCSSHYCMHMHEFHWLCYTHVHFTSFFCTILWPKTFSSHCFYNFVSKKFSSHACTCMNFIDDVTQTCGIYIFLFYIIVSKKSNKKSCIKLSGTTVLII